MLLILAALIFFGRVLYVKIGLDMAASDACRAAVEALEPGPGMTQGLVAGRATFRDWDAQLSGLSISVNAQGEWVRGTPVSCVAEYGVRVGDIPFVSAFYSGRSMPLRSVVWSRVETFRSDWSRQTPHQ